MDLEDAKKIAKRFVHFCETGETNEARERQAREAPMFRP